MRYRFIWLSLWVSLVGLTIAACNNPDPPPSPTANNPKGNSTAIGQQSTPTHTPIPPSPTPEPTATATSSPPPTPSPTATAPPTATPTATATPVPSLQQLTQGGCCTQPAFSPDGERVLFIDKPSADAAVGVYGVTLANPEPNPVLIDDVIGFRSPDRTIVGTFEGDLVRLTNEVSGESWTIDTGANWPRFSPDGQRILWVATDREGPFDQRQSDVWLADLDGSNRRRLLSNFGSRSADWFPDSQHILMIGRDQPWEEERILFTYNVDTEQRTNLYSHKQIRGGDISPNGGWVAYFLSFADDPGDNGLWLLNVADASRRKLEVPTFGAYRWRDENSLLYIPFRTSAEDSMQLWRIKADTGQIEPLTDPETLSFSISNGDWDVSADGQQVIFVSSSDQNIWLITLP